MRKFHIMLASVVVLALLSMACGALGSLSKLKSEVSDQATKIATALPDQAEIEKTVQAELTKVAVEEAPTEAMTEMPAVEPTAEVTEESLAGQEATDETQADGEPLDLSLAGLENLYSYRSDMTVRWDGTENGEPSTGYLGVQYASVREPPAYEMTIESDNFDAADTGGTGTASFIQVGDTAWFHESETDSWMQVPAGSFDFAGGVFFTPQDFLSGFNTIGRRSPGTEEINGITCYKYTFDENDFAVAGSDQTEVSRADGEAYVAVDGNYIVKLSMELEMKAGNTEIASFDSGTMWLDFELSDINQPIVIEPPAEATQQTQGRDDIPTMPDAAVQSAMENFIYFTVDASVADATQFYETQMSQNGWQSEGDPMVMEDTAFLSYTKDGQTASIVISKDDSGTSVIISVE